MCDGGAVGEDEGPGELGWVWWNADGQCPAERIDGDCLVCREWVVWSYKRLDVSDLLLLRVNEMGKT